MTPIIHLHMMIYLQGDFGHTLTQDDLLTGRLWSIIKWGNKRRRKHLNDPNLLYLWNFFEAFTFTQSTPMFIWAASYNFTTE